jgi:hypothetical protein
MKTRLGISFACAAALILALGCGSGGGGDSLQGELDSLDSSVTSGSAAFTYAAGDSASSITDDFGLPAKTKGGYTVAWTETTDDSNNVAVSGTAVSVLQSTSDRTVVLTAAVTVGGKSGTKDFDFTIKLTDKGYIQGLARSYHDSVPVAIAPLVGATVKAATQADMGSPAATAATDNDGEYVMKLAADDYYVSFAPAEATTLIAPWYAISESLSYSSGNTTLVSGLERRSDSTFAVSAGAVTTVNFTIFGY